MKTSLIYAAGCGFLLSSAFEDAIRNPCEGVIPHGWIVFFLVFAMLCAMSAIYLRNHGK